MNEKTLKTMIEAGVIKRACIKAEGALIYVEVEAGSQTITATTIKGKIKTWGTLDTAAMWVRSLGIGKVQLDIAKWQPRQKKMQF